MTIDIAGKWALVTGATLQTCLIPAGVKQTWPGTSGIELTRPIIHNAKLESG
jgi:hypothetical protein